MTTVVDATADDIVLEEVDVSDVIVTDTGATVVVVSTSAIDIVEVDTNQVVLEQSTSVNVISACIQGPQGPQGLAGGLAQIDATEIPVLGVLVVDSVLITEYRSIKWIITFKDNISGVYRTSEIMAVHNGTDVFYSQYGIVGEAVLHSLVVQLTAGSMELQITNSEVNPLNVSVLRLGTNIV